MRPPLAAYDSRLCYRFQSAGGAIREISDYTPDAHRDLAAEYLTHYDHERRTAVGPIMAFLQENQKVAQ